MKRPRVLLWLAHSLSLDNHVSAPFTDALIGMILAGWGWCRIKRAINGRQAGAGIAALACGYLLGSVAGVVFPMVAF